MSPSCDHSLAARRRRLRMGQRKHLEPALMWRPGFLLGRRCGWKFRCDIKNTWRFCAHTKQRKYPPTNEVWCQVANAHSRLWYGSNYRSTQMMDFSLKIPWDITPCSFLCQGPFCGRTYLCVGITAASPKNSKKTQLHLKSTLGNPSWCLEVSLRAMAESSTWLYAFAWLPIPIAGPVMFTATLYLNRLGSRVTDIVDKLLSFVLCACHIVFFCFFLWEPLLISCHAIFENQEALQPKNLPTTDSSTVCGVFFFDWGSPIAYVRHRVFTIGSVDYLAKNSSKALHYLGIFGKGWLEF